MGSIQHGMLQIGGNRAWLLGLKGDRSKSAVWTCPNVFATSPVWSKGADLDGVYTLVRPSDATPGDVLVYGTGGTPVLLHDYDFTLNDGGFTAIHEPTWFPPGWVAGQGWNAWQEQDGVGNWHIHLNILSSLFSAANITRIVATYRATRGTGSGVNVAGDFEEFVADPGGISLAQQNYPPALPSGSLITKIWNGFQSGITQVGFNSYVSFAGSQGNLNGSLVLVRLQVYGNGSGGDAQVAASSDNGGTWAAPIDLGASPGVFGGFDLQHGGSVSYAAIAGAVLKATTIGGSYSSYATYTPNPILIEIPWGTKNSRSPNSGSSPQVIVGLDAPDGSGHTLFWYVGGSPVNITPVIGGNPGIPVGPNSLCTWLGLYVALIATFGGAIHLVTSNNGGGTWVDRGAVNASYLRLRRLSATPGQLYGAGAALDYSSTFGASLVAKTKPSSADLVFWETYG